MAIINPSTPPINSPALNSSIDISTRKGVKHRFKQYFSEKSSNDPQHPSNLQKIIAEFVGTYIFIFVGCGAALIDRVATISIVGIGLVWGLVAMALVYALGHISDAHFNPAVSIAYGAARRLPWPHVLMYVVSHLTGSTLACLTLKLLFNDQDNIVPALTQYKSPTSDLQAIVWEFIITFILMFIICGAASDDRASKALFGVAKGVTILFNAIIAGPITGGSMNPARSIGPAIVSGVYKNLWVYIVSPILGAIVAIMIYSVLRAPMVEKDEEDNKAINISDVFLRSDI